VEYFALNLATGPVAPYYFGSVSMNNIIDQLQWRGLVHQSTDESLLKAHLQTPRALYAGFDPTANSLHVGSLLPLMVLRRFQQKRRAQSDVQSAAGA
jgi:hypothetical protein